MEKACVVHEHVVAVEKYAQDNQISKEDAARIMAEGASASKQFAKDKKKLASAAAAAADPESGAAALASAVLAGGGGGASSGGGGGASSGGASAHDLRERGGAKSYAEEAEEAEEEEDAAGGGAAKAKVGGKRARLSAPPLLRQASARTLSAVEELKTHLRSDEGADAIAAYVANMEHERLVKLLKALALGEDDA